MLVREGPRDGIVPEVWDAEWNVDHRQRVYQSMPWVMASVTQENLSPRTGQKGDKEGSLRGPPASSALDHGFHASDQRLQCLALVLQQGHGLGVPTDTFLLLPLHEFGLESGPAVVGLHHARDPVVDNADLSGADDLLGSE